MSKIAGLLAGDPHRGERLAPALVERDLAC